VKPAPKRPPLATALEARTMSPPVVAADVAAAMMILGLAPRGEVLRLLPPEAIESAHRSKIRALDVEGQERADLDAARLLLLAELDRRSA
jgi:hypothetical protein